MIRFAKTACITAVLLVASTTFAQDFDLSWHTIDGGGGTSTGGGFTLSGTIGQPDATSFAAPMANGTFSLVGGFWPAATPVCTCPGDLNGDQLKNGRDVQQFIGCILSGGTCACSDMNGSGTVDATDVNSFVADLLAGAACP